MTPTKPYTKAVMPTPMAAITSDWVTASYRSTTPSAMMMISAERMKSVRMAPLILVFSSNVSAGLPASSWPSERRNLCSSFSTPSKHRYAPPIISNGVIAAGRKNDSSSASGTRMILLTSEPLATAQIIGSSLSAETPVTWLAFSARSSPTTPAVFFAAILVIRATSSKTDVMSSSRVKSEAKAMCAVPEKVGMCKPRIITDNGASDRKQPAAALSAGLRRGR